MLKVVNNFYILNWETTEEIIEGIKVNEMAINNLRSADDTLDEQYSTPHQRIPITNKHQEN